MSSYEVKSFQNWLEAVYDEMIMLNPHVLAQAVINVNATGDFE